jgi:hypothetical protein
VVLVVPGGTLTLPSDTIVASGVATLPSGGDITLTDGVTKITVPPNTAVDQATGVITVLDGGVVTLPGEDGLIDTAHDNIQLIVPAGASIDPDTGLITLEDAGEVTLPGSDRIVNSSSGGSEKTASSGDDMEFSVPAGTTIDPDTGVATITRGGGITPPDGTTVTVASGTTIDPLTGIITQPEAETGGQAETGESGGTSGSGGGCDGMSTGAAGLWATALASSRLYSKSWKKAKNARAKTDIGI